MSPKFSKNGKRIGRPPKDVGEAKTVKYGDTDSKRRDPERELCEAEKMHVIACYQKTEDLERCAKEVHTTWGKANAVILDAIQMNPESFHGGESALGMSVLLKFITLQAMKQSLKHLEKADSTKAILTAKYAGEMATKYKKVHDEWVGKSGGTDIDAITKQRADVERQLRELSESGAGEEEAGAATAGTPAEGSGQVEGDA